MLSIFSNINAEGWWMVATRVRPPRARPLRRAISDVEDEESRPLENNKKNKKIVIEILNQKN